MFNSELQQSGDFQPLAETTDTRYKNNPKNWSYLDWLMVASNQTNEFFYLEKDIQKQLEELSQSPDKPTEKQINNLERLKKKLKDQLY